MNTFFFFAGNRLSKIGDRHAAVRRDLYHTTIIPYGPRKSKTVDFRTIKSSMFCRKHWSEPVLSVVKKPASTMTSESSPSDVDKPREDVDTAPPEVGSTGFLYGDKWNLVKLLFLYVLQGVPLGFAEAFPIILKTKQFSYFDQVRTRHRKATNVCTYLP